MKSQSQNDLQHQLIKCITACETCANECLSEKHAAEMKECIRTDRDCADLAALVSRYVARDSQFTRSLMKRFLKVLQACETECNRHEHWHCKKCAEICKETRKACEKYLDATPKKKIGKKDSLEDEKTPAAGAGKAKPAGVRTSQKPTTSNTSLSDGKELDLMV